MICRICGQQSEPFGTAKVMEKYECQYWRCPVCGFVQVKDPHWLAESYGGGIETWDIGQVQRNQELARLTRLIILFLLNPTGRFLDFGGSYGLFVRMMRDYGFDFYWHDKFSRNLFARGFDADMTGGVRYELVTAFEVFEHLVDPVGDVDRILQVSKNLFITTNLVPRHNPKPTEWWYYSLHHGQHVSLFSRQSMMVLADKFNLHLQTDGVYRHLLTENHVSSFLFFSILRHQGVFEFLAERFRKRPSLIEDDYAKVTGSPLR